VETIAQKRGVSTAPSAIVPQTFVSVADPLKSYSLALTMIDFPRLWVVASSLGEWPDRGRATALGRLWWRLRRSSSVSAVAYYPLPFYLGLLLLAAAAVFGAWLDRP
jgi:hypothetical protein